MNEFKLDRRYEANDIAKIVNESLPGHWKHLTSCGGSVRRAIRELGIKPLNDKKSNRTYSGSDAQRIYDYMIGVIPSSELPLLDSPIQSEQSLFTDTYLDLTNITGLKETAFALSVDETLLALHFISQGLKKAMTFVEIVELKKELESWQKS